MGKNYEILQPLGTGVLIKRSKPRTVTEGGIHLPETEVERPPEGLVLRTGTGPKKAEADKWGGFTVEQGDFVLINRYGARDVTDDLAIVKSEDILARIEGGELFPLDTTLLIRVLPRETQAGSIVLPEFSRMTQEFGVVVDRGDRCKIIHEGDYVFVASTQGMHYRAHGQDYILLREEAVKAYADNQ